MLQYLNSIEMKHCRSNLSKNNWIFSRYVPRLVGTKVDALNSFLFFWCQNLAISLMR